MFVSVSRNLNDVSAKQVHDLIYRLGPCSSIKSAEYKSLNILLNLFKEKYMPDEDENPNKIQDIVDFKILKQRLNPKKMELHLVRSNGTSESISWLSCFNGPAPYDEKLTTAMILALHPTHDKEIAKGLTSYRYKDEFIKEYTGQGGVVPLLFDKNAHHQRIFKKEDSAFADAWVSYYNEKCKLAGYIPCKECANPKKLGGSNTIIDDVGGAEMDDGWVLVTKPKRR